MKKGFGWFFVVMGVLNIFRGAITPLEGGFGLILFGILFIVLGGWMINTSKPKVSKPEPDEKPEKEPKDTDPKQGTKKQEQTPTTDEKSSGTGETVTRKDEQREIGTDTEVTIKDDDEKPTETSVSGVHSEPTSIPTQTDNTPSIIIAEPPQEYPQPLSIVIEPPSKYPVMFENGLLYVDYQITLPQSETTYPILKYPNRGTIVRSYRDGASKLRGFKERSFEEDIKSFFGQQFLITGQIHLTTGNHTRPYEPDIAIIDKNNTNLRIDIEIDEPYAGITRNPTHCKGDDTLRDLFFTDRGWVVIRFSEHQVHTQPMSCLKFIAEVIKSAHSTYTVPAELMNIPPIHYEETWDVLQAQKWERENYRENYLGHEFKKLDIEDFEYVSPLTDQEIKEEAEVESSSIGIVDNTESISVNKDNHHDRDSRIKFYPEPHIYTIDGIQAPSVTTVISKFFPEFDTERWAAHSAKKEGLTVDEIKHRWSAISEDAAKAGGYLHEQIENYFLKVPYDGTSKEFNFFLDFKGDHSHLEPFRTEWRIFDEEYNVAGTIDLVAKNNGVYEIYDWKRSKNVVDENTGNPITVNKYQSGIGPLARTPDTSFYRYVLQQSMYKYILEKHYDITIANMYIVIFYPDYDRYYKYKTPDFSKGVKAILDAL